MIIPSLEYEQNLWNSGIQHIAGVDEVGRGALAGPVVAAAVVFDPSHTPLPGVRDSKTLSKLQKNSLNEKICSRCLCFSIGEASAAEIDQLGIVPATVLAMNRALQGLPTVDHLLIDGLPFKNPELLSQYKKTFIVKGDAVSYSIAAASIIAKVYRDTVMSEVAHSFGHYAFEKNVGYGTTTHLSALKQHGISSMHRRSFLIKQMGESS